MKDWLKEYNLADVEPFIEALEKTREQYYPDEIDLLKDAVSIPGISMTYVLNKALKIKKKSDPDLFAPGDPCKCKCKNDCQKKGCEKCKEIRDNCEICTKNEAYEMLTTGMIGGPSIVFCRHLIYTAKRTQKLADQFSAWTQILYIFFALVRKCLAKKKKVLNVTQGRKTN